MKKYLIILAAIFTGFNSFAQDPQLLDNIWYFSNGELNGESLELPYSSFSNELSFYSDNISLSYSTCKHQDSGSIIYNINNVFDLVGGPFTLLGVCAWEFIDDHLSVYYDENDIPKNTFSYTIEDDGSNIVLTINNGNGDFVVYNNYILANSDFSLGSLTLFPNPVNSILKITSQGNLRINKISVYNILGNLVLEKQNIVNQIDLSQLASGLLFVKIETDQGVITKKIIKE